MEWFNGLELKWTEGEWTAVGNGWNGMEAHLTMEWNDGGGLTGGFYSQNRPPRPDGSERDLASQEDSCV